LRKELNISQLFGLEKINSDKHFFTAHTIFTFVKNYHLLGHDITATAKKSGERLSYISIGAFNQCKSWILYESLNCNEFNAGVSGNGGSKVISEIDIKTSLSKFKYLAGESSHEMESAISSYKPCNSASGVLKKVLTSLGYKPSREDIRVTPDSESLADVERFLTDIQEYGEIVIDFL